MDEATWTPEQAEGAMLDIATPAAEGWAEMACLSVEGALSCLAFDECGELCRWIGAVTTGTAIELVEDAERIAAEMGLSDERRRKLITDRAGIYHGHLVDLILTRGPRGSA